MHAFHAAAPRDSADLARNDSAGDDPAAAALSDVDTSSVLPRYSPFALRRSRVRAVLLRALLKMSPVKDHGWVLGLHDITSPRAADALVERTIRCVWAKGYANASISLAEVDLADVRPITRSLEMARYERAREQLVLFRRARLKPFVPALLKFRFEEGYRLALPPVLELHGSTFVVVDGAHRLKALTSLGERTAVCVIIQGSDLPRLPGEPADSWDDVEVFGRERSSQKKIHKIRRKSFRPTGRTLRSEQFRYPSVNALREECSSILDEDRQQHLAPH